MMRIKRFFSAFVICILVSIFTSIYSFAAETSTGTVTGSVVNVRSGPGTSYGIVTQAVRGTTVTVISQENGWYKIVVNGKEGYMIDDYLSVNSGQASIQGIVTGSVVNVRSGPGTSYGIISQVNKGASITITATLNGWYKISINGKEGYISSYYVSVAAVNGDEVLAYANQFLGVPYLYGGTTPSGFDCSGFTQYVYSHFGISIPRTSASQYSAYAKVSRDQLQKGDLVFFSSPDSSSVKHVGIYAGDGKFIDSPSTGSYVRYDTLTSGYFNTYYYGAVRVTR
jgi:uncharacterized protein YgiM (DUF1202 family)